MLMKKIIGCIVLITIILASLVLAQVCPDALKGSVSKASQASDNIVSGLRGEKLKQFTGGKKSVSAFFDSTDPIRRAELLHNQITVTTVRKGGITWGEIAGNIPGNIKQKIPNFTPKQLANLNFGEQETIWRITQQLLEGVLVGN